MKWMLMSCLAECLTHSNPLENDSYCCYFESHMVYCENLLQLTLLVLFCMFPLYLLDQARNFCEAYQYGSASCIEVSSNEKYQADKILRTLFNQITRMYFYIFSVLSHSTKKIWDVVIEQNRTGSRIKLEVYLNMAPAFLENSRSVWKGVWWS